MSSSERATALPASARPGVLAGPLAAGVQAVAWMPGALQGAHAAPQAMAWDDFEPAFAALDGDLATAFDGARDAAPRAAHGAAHDGAFGDAFADAFGDAFGDVFADALPDFASTAACEAAHGAHPGSGALIAALEARAAEREAALHAEFVAALEAQAAADAARHQQELQQAYAEGHAAGCAEGEAAALQALAATAATLQEARAQLAAHEARWLANLQENVAALAVAVARHVVDHEVATDASVVRAMAARAVAEFPVEEPLTLRVHPGDLPTLRAVMEGVAAEARPAGPELRWIADAQLVRGGCVVEGRERIVDGRVDAALERIYRTLSGHHA